MKLFKKYLGLVYLKYFFIVFIALEFFYIFIDVLTNLSDFPKSANLQLLYIGLTFLVAINYIAPLSLILAGIVTFIALIRSNEELSFYALGISKNAVIMPVFCIAMFFALLQIGLNSTPLAHARDYQKFIMGKHSSFDTSNSVFLKFQNKFIYFNKLYSRENFATGIKIFVLQNGELKQKVEAKNAKFQKNIWILKDAKITTLPDKFELKNEGLKVKFKKELEVLKGFEPKTMKNIYGTSNSYSICDIIESMVTLKNENINTQKMKAQLYFMIIFPFISPFLIMIIYYYLPVTGRMKSLALSAFISVLCSLGIWGALFLLMKFSVNGVILPELGVLAPCLAVMLFALYKFYRNA